MDGGGRLVPEHLYAPFPYREEDLFEHASGVVTPVLRPTLPIRVRFGAERWGVRALADTGAPFTLFDKSTGDALGVDFSREDAHREKHKIAGDERIAQIEEVELTIPAFGEDLRWTTEVGFFLLDWGMPFGGLLGQVGFLDRWVVAFNYPKSFVIEERESYTSRQLPIAVEDIQEMWELQELGWKGPPGVR